MRVGLALAIVPLIVSSSASASAPGEGTRILAEVGASLYGATLATSHGEQRARSGLDGPAVRLRGGIGFAVARGLVLGASAGLDRAFTDSTGEICCGSIKRVDIARLGLEAAYYPNPEVGFRIQAGFGIAAAALRPDADGREPGSALAENRPTGVYFTGAVTRDFAVTAHTRIGGNLRSEFDVLRGKDGSHLYSLESFTPSFSLVVLTDWPG